MKQLIETFYNAFQKCDAETMISCYHDDIIFEDPAFGTLKGDRAKYMWLMLCESQKDKDFKVVFDNVDANDDSGSASWEAFYTFSKTGRKVHNKINAEFTFKDGKIITHIDSFDLHKWSKQALGLKGWVLGKTVYFRNKLQSQTNKMLNSYIEKSKAISG
ncbi:nuclear transport factor 2 family protein [Psychroserpens sp. XS_ASV72]|uniref:nuclear transport factor 2 family protein n=1 Tax=Psychroserpens sp. XS_ASV72 TaxID=3241293 RepID=UPI00351393D3